MTTRLRLLAALTVTATLVGACGDDDDSAATTTSFQIGTPATIDMPQTTFTPAPTIGPVTVDTADIPVVPQGTSDIPFVPPDTSDTVALIEVTVGENTGSERIELVPLGSVVTLTVVNQQAADEFHLHGYDLGDGQEFAAGEAASFTFTADTAGDFELESHVAEDAGSDPVLLILRVQ